MNIYIYGSSGFKKEIHRTLEHANIKFKIGSDGTIKDIISLKELQNTIKNNPDDIYLIDDEKIIKNNAINKKIKFLAPKDGIEEQFLKENNIPEVHVNSFDELPKYILRKYAQVKAIDSEIQQSIIGIVDKAYEDNIHEHEEIILDDELAMLLSKDENSGESGEGGIQEDTFIDNEENTLEEGDVEDIYENEGNNIISPVQTDEIDAMLEDIHDTKVENQSLEQLTNLTDFNEDFGLNNVSYDYDHENESKNETEDDFIKELQSMDIKIEEDKDEFIEKSVEFNGNIDDFLKDLENMEEHIEPFEEEEDFTEKLEVENSDLKMEKIEFDENIDVDVSHQNMEKNLEEGDNMEDQFSQLDLLNEKDVLDALGSISYSEPKKEKEVKKEVVPTISASKMDLDLGTTDSKTLMELLTQLLNNKTLEITIKIKD